jgi:flagellar assembly protein FliH
MLSRAVVVADPWPIEPFDWGDAATRAVPPPSVLQLLRVPFDEPDAPEPAAAQAEPAPGPDHQARLAALERDAFAKGYAQGERAGVEAGAKRAEAMLRRVAQTLEQLSQLRRTIVRETEKQMVQLAIDLSRRIVHRELTLDPTLVAAMAHVAVDRLGESTPARIRLNPEDYAVVVAQRGEQWEGAQVAITPDPAIARGGCVVESDFGTVDGRLDAQFDEVTRALLGDVAPSAPEVHAD